LEEAHEKKKKWTKTVYMPLWARSVSVFRLVFATSYLKRKALNVYI